MGCTAGDRPGKSRTCAGVNESQFRSGWDSSCTSSTAAPPVAAAAAAACGSMLVPVGSAHLPKPLLSIAFALEAKRGERAQRSRDPFFAKVVRRKGGNICVFMVFWVELGCRRRLPQARVEDYFSRR